MVILIMLGVFFAVLFFAFLAYQEKNVSGSIVIGAIIAYLLLGVILYIALNVAVLGWRAF